MKTNTRHAMYWSIGTLAIGMITPSSIIFYLEVFVAHIDPLTSIADVLRRQFAEGHNLFLIALVGLIPFVALSLVCFAASRHMKSAQLACIAVGGLLGILGLMVPGHIAVWYPLYGPGHMSSTAVVAFFFIPFYCIASLCAGLFVGWLVSKLPLFRSAGV